MINKIIRISWLLDNSRCNQLLPDVYIFIVYFIFPGKEHVTLILFLYSVLSSHTFNNRFIFSFNKLQQIKRISWLICMIIVHQISCPFNLFQFTYSQILQECQTMYFTHQQCCTMFCSCLKLKQKLTYCSTAIVNEAISIS